MRRTNNSNKINKTKGRSVLNIGVGFDGFIQIIEFTTNHNFKFGFLEKGIYVTCFKDNIYRNAKAKLAGSDLKLC